MVEAPESCGYSLTHGRDYNILLVDYTDCHVTLEVFFRIVGMFLLVTNNNSNSFFTLKHALIIPN